ncbi:alanine racemase [Savagea faecisuis]|uniref:Alanine racemase n=1 Tax=Savagea faecisuis TaxID=1274803 RepID=A0ABW3GXX9_9BACL
MMTSYRPTRMSISRSAIVQNIQNIKRYYEEQNRPIRHFFAVVKANGYGHGMEEVVRASESEVNYFAVATVDEALRLRKMTKLPILVLGPSPVESIPEAVTHQITLTVPSVEWLVEAENQYPREPLILHMKLNTGMNRIGLQTGEEIERAFQLLRNTAYEIEGVFTHFARADEEERSWTDEQVRIFEELLQYFPERPSIVHVSNSAATLRFPEYVYDGVRYGISLYGLPPSPYVETILPIRLIKAMTLTTEVAKITKVPSQSQISYGGTYETKKLEYVATLPIGYADGLRRQLTGQQVIIKGSKYPIIGTICMDQCMILVNENISVGEIVTLIGIDKGEEISVNDWSNSLNTINYEVCTSFSARISRELSQ